MGETILTEDHLDALADGRRMGLAVRAYLEMLAADEPRKRGRKRTRESVAAQLAQAKRTVELEEDPIERLTAMQAVRDLGRELANMEPAVDRQAIEDAFVAVAARYSAKKGIEYQTWRDMGVPAHALRAAGIYLSGVDPERAGAEPEQTISRRLSPAARSRGNGSPQSLTAAGLARLQQLAEGPVSDLTYRGSAGQTRALLRRGFAEIVGEKLQITEAGMKELHRHGFYLDRHPLTAGDG